MYRLPRAKGSSRVSRRAASLATGTFKKNPHKKQYPPGMSWSSSKTAPTQNLSLARHALRSKSQELI